MKMIFKNNFMLLKVLADDSVARLKTLAILDKVPNDIDRHPVLYRKMDDGRCFVVQSVSIPVGMLYDLLTDQENGKVRQMLFDWMGHAFQAIYDKRKEEEDETGGH